MRLGKLAQSESVYNVYLSPVAMKTVEETVAIEYIYVWGRTHITVQLGQSLL